METEITLSVSIKWETLPDWEGTTGEWHNGGKNLTSVKLSKWDREQEIIHLLNADQINELTNKI